MDVPTSRRIVLLGKTGAGKSSLANTIFGEDVFKISHLSTSGTSECQAKTKSVNGRSLTLIDTPGFFDTDRSDKEMKPRIVRCITECAPGSHAFLIVLKVEKFTEHENHVITEICKYFSEDALKYAVIVFTHGDQLEGMKIEEFVRNNKNLRDLVKKCGGRCHVVDNKCWRNNKGDKYRHNPFQVAELFNTLDKMTDANNGRYYTNEMLQAVKRAIQREEEHIRQTSPDMSQEASGQAKKNVFERLLIRSAGILTGALLGALLGVGKTIIPNLKQFLDSSAKREMVASAALSGGFEGGAIGYNVAEGAQTAGEAMQNTTKALLEKF